MEYRPYYFAREWVASGHNVTIVASTFSHVRTKGPDSTAPISEELIDGIRYVWLKTPSYSGNGVGRVKNIFSFLTQLYRRRKQLVDKLPPDIVIASSTYPLDIYPARTIAKTYGAKLVYEVHDLWPLTLIEVGGMSVKHPFIRLLQRGENDAYRMADRVISLLPKTRAYMVSHGMGQDKWRWVPNGVDPAEWSGDIPEIPAEHQDVISHAKARGSFLIGYAGGHSISNGLDTLIEAALKIKACPIEFILVGKGPEKERLKAKSNGARVHFLPPIPKPSIPALLSQMDGLYMGYRDEPLYRFGVCPNKLMDYLMSEKPVIFAINGHDDTVDRAGCGFTIPAEDVDQLVDAVVKLSSVPLRDREQMGHRGRQHVLDCHDYAVLAHTFLEAAQ
jgi:glycosyltransferase involved in cell wall biosynthesis